MARRSCISVSPVRTAVRISRHQQAALAGHLQNFAQRDFEILLNVVAKGFERRNVEDFGAVSEIAGERLAHEAIDAGEKRSQGFARTGGSGDQGGVPGENVRPALLLRLGRSAEAAPRTSPAPEGGPSPKKGVR